MATLLDVTDITSNGQVTNNEWVGDGIFDTLINAVTKNIQLQYDQGRITSANYGTVYLGAMQSVLEQSIKFLVQKEQVEAEVLAKHAEIRDDHGMTVDSSGQLVKDNSDTTNKHYHLIKAAEKEVESKEWDNLLKHGKLNIEYNLQAVANPDGTTSLNEYLPFFDATWVTDPSGTFKNTRIPRTALEMQALKTRIESDVAINTAKGYEADSMYKVYKSLQELMFALTNAGIVTDTNAGSTSGVGTVYSRILKGMEKSMNAQTKVWDTNGIGIDLDGDGQVS